MQKGFCPKQGKNLKNYAIFRFSCKPSVTISSVAKTVTRKVPSPETRINTGLFGTSKPRELLPLVAERLNLTHFVYKTYRVVFAVF